MTTLITKPPAIPQGLHFATDRRLLDGQSREYRYTQTPSEVTTVLVDLLHHTVAADGKVEMIGVTYTSPDRDGIVFTVGRPQVRDFTTLLCHPLVDDEQIRVPQGGGLYQYFGNLDSAVSWHYLPYGIYSTLRGTNGLSRINPIGMFVD